MMRRVISCLLSVCLLTMGLTACHKGQTSDDGLHGLYLSMEKTEYPADTQSINVVIENTRDDDRILPHYDIEVQQEDGKWVRLYGFRWESAQIIKAHAITNYTVDFRQFSYDFHPGHYRFTIYKGAPGEYTKLLIALEFDLVEP